MAERRSLLVGLSWFIVLVGAGWYLGRVPAGEKPSVMALLVLVLVFISTVALGATLMAHHYRWLLTVAVAVGGGFLATVVYSMSLFSVPNTLDTYYPLVVFLESSIALLLPLAIGAMLGARPGPIRLIGGSLFTCAMVLAGVFLAYEALHPPETPESHLSDIASRSAAPVYYAGSHFRGRDLEHPVIFSQNAESGSISDRTFDRGDQLYVSYGSMQMQMHWGPTSPRVECVLHVGPRGTLLAQERLGAWDAYTADVTLRVEEIGRDEMEEIVNALRPAGTRAAQPTTGLPPPSKETRRLLQKTCR